MTAIRRLWAGEVPLENAFWSWAVIGGIAVNIVTGLAFLILIAADEPIAAWVAGYGFSVPYNVLATVGVWRSAEREQDNPNKATVYRAITLVGMVILTLT